MIVHGPARRFVFAIRTLQRTGQAIAGAQDRLAWLLHYLGLVIFRAFPQRRRTALLFCKAVAVIEATV